MSGDVAITREASGPPRPSLDTFHLVFQKGKDDMVLASNKRIKNDYAVKSLMDDISLAEDLKLFKFLQMTKMLAHQDHIFY